MKQTVTAVQPDLVVMTAQHLYTAGALLQMADSLNAMNVPLAFGGRIFNVVPGLRQRVPGFFLGKRIEEAPAIVERLLSTRPAAPTVEDIGEEYSAALAHYRERQMFIEADTWQRMVGTDIQAQHLTNATQAFERNIIAALELGDLSLLCTDIEWVAGLLEGNEIPREVLSRYLDSYHRAAQTNLDERGKIVIEYLSQLNGKRSAEKQ
jgi:hypothetical protein